MGTRKHKEQEVWKKLKPYETGCKEKTKEEVEENRKHLKVNITRSRKRRLYRKFEVNKA